VNNIYSYYNLALVLFACEEICHRKKLLELQPIKEKTFVKQRYSVKNDAQIRIVVTSATLR
jgi:hypothetical protein